ncbi:MAG: hypothetical protein J3R72DRAFT_495168 [Linnemannia gamsii]|nr:MAG: hypothetical protein J3R72DRAFT_495168 [Linnemannia gamsii]
MTRKIVRHSILTALILIATCSAAPSPLILTSPDILSSSSIDTFGNVDPLSTDHNAFLSNPDAFGSGLGVNVSDFGLSGPGSLDPISSSAAVGYFADPTSAFLSSGGVGVGDVGVQSNLDNFEPPTQVVPSQRVHLASETEVTPTTGVFPNLIFQPAIQLYDPLVNNFQTYGVGPAYTNGYAGAGRNGGLGGATLFEKRQLVGGSMGSAGPVGGPIGGGLAGGGAFGPSPMGGPMGLPPTIVNGAPTDVSTDTLIQPIVNIQPHALQPIPVPVSTPYDYPVPVGVPVPVRPIGPVGGGGWVGSDCDWGKWGSGWHGGDDCDDDRGKNHWGNSWGGGGGWGDDCDWGWGNDWSGW